MSAKSGLERTGRWFSDLWHRVMAVTVDEGIGWQKRRPGMLWAALVILFAIFWMAIGWSVSGIVGRVLSRRDKRLS